MMNSLKDLSSFDNLGDRQNQFREIADKICAIATMNSVELIGYRSTELPFYSALPREKQQEVIQQLKIFLRTMEMTLAHGDRLDSPDRSVWHAMVTMGFVPPSDMFNRFSSDDVIEIYDLQGRQIWRNFNFLKICSYTLEEMYSVDWTSRYARDSQKSAECVQKVTDLLIGKTPEIYDANVQDHILEETSSSERYVLQARHDWIVRLKKQDGNISAWLACSKVKILGKSLANWDTRPSLHVIQTRRPPSAELTPVGS